MLAIRLAERHQLPIAAIVQLTRRCNLRCRHCFQVDRSGSELMTGNWEVVLGRLAEAGVLFVTLTGGEPAVRPDFLEIVRLARALRFAVKIKSNGVLLGESTCDALAGAAVLQVQLSFYSVDPQLHDRVTGFRGSHLRTIAAARRLRDRGVRVVLTCTLQTDTFDRYRELAEFAADERMQFSFGSSLSVEEDGCDGPAKYRLSADQLAQLFSDARLSGSFVPPDPDVKRSMPVCRVGTAAFAVAPNGDVWPCLSLREPVGNLLDKPLQEIWVDNPKVQRYAKLHWTDLPTCRSCEFLPFCSRCHGDALVEDGDLLGPSKAACQIARARAAAYRKKGRAGG